MYAVTSTPEDSRTRATFRSAEFGFFGVVAYTRVHTPRFWGLPLSAGAADLRRIFCRPLRTSWLMVGILDFLQKCTFPRFPNRRSRCGQFDRRDYETRRA